MKMPIHNEEEFVRPRVLGRDDLQEGDVLDEDEPQDPTAGQVERGILRNVPKVTTLGDWLKGTKYDSNEDFSFHLGKQHASNGQPPRTALVGVPNLDEGRYVEGYNEGLQESIDAGFISESKAREFRMLFEPAVDASGEVRTVSDTGGEKGVKPQRYDLIPIHPLGLLAELYGNGAKKYAAHNFRKGYEWSKSYAAAMRHMTAFWNGEDIDPEMGVPHVICAAFHMFALAEFMEFSPEFDDRFKRDIPQD